MAIYFKNPVATFIHIPKTAGSSFQQWSKDNFENIIVGPPGHRHSKASVLQHYFGDLGFKFTFVRNPFSRLVSMFYFIGQRAQERVEKRRSGRKTKKSTNEYDDIKIVEQYNLGFEKYIHSLNEKNYKKQPYEAGDRWYSRKTPMTEWIDIDIDLIIKIENLDKDFYKLQKFLGCYYSIPYVNRSNHKNYKEHYNKTTKQIVENMFKKDLEKFGYEY